MIRTLTGKITQLGENWLVIDVQGVGYLVGYPTLSNQFVLESTITLFTYLAVRETALDLYGFPQQNELQMFELLLGIPKVGPKSALQILTLATPTLLIEAVHKNDSVYLHKLSGIGKKTCENTIQYLQNKIDKLPAINTTMEDGLNQTQTDAIDALIALGYDTTSARTAIINITDKDKSLSLNSLVKQALKNI